MAKMCHCGKPLHYNSPEVQRTVEMLVAELGEDVVVVHQGTGKSYLVPRHRIALHGLRADELDTLGFKEVPEGYRVPAPGTKAT